jgi:mono/diheme cytochrome c family protein
LARSDFRGARRALLLVAALGAAAGCTEIDNALARVPIFAFMHSSPAFDPQENPRPAPPGAVPYLSPLGAIDPPLGPMVTEDELQAYATWLGQNPVPATDAGMLEVGRVMYERHCFVCHGATGRGDGPIVRPGAFPFATNLVEDALAVGRSDAYMYAVIRAGRGLMPAYGSRIAESERWAIVNYVRVLQGGGGAAAPAPQIEAPAAQPPQQQPGAAAPSPPGQEE